MFVDDRLVDEFPERLGRLKFGRVGRQEDEADAFGNVEVRRPMPTGVVYQENDDAVSACAGLFCESAQQFLEIGLGDAGVNVPEAFSCRR